jgi:hypothetical protein
MKFFYKVLNCDWIWIGLSIHLEKWIWIVNHIFVMDLDWIDNPKNWIEQQPGYNQLLLVKLIIL